MAYSVCTYAGHGRLLERAYLARQWRETLTQVQAKRVPRSQHSFSMDKVSYEIIAVYNDTPTFLNIGELNFVYNGNGWEKKKKNGSEILTQLDEICNS